MDGCCLVSESPNITYEAVRKNTIEEDFSSVVRDLAERNKARRVVIYCQSLDMCASLYAHFLRYLQDASYYPPGVEQVSDNRLSAMFHSCTDKHNNRVGSALAKLMVWFKWCLRPWLWEWGWISRAAYTRSVYDVCDVLILFINKTLTRQTGYELAYGKVYKLSIRLRVFQVMPSACALT